MEQKGISMMNDFAKYSKIQRKINAIDEELSDTKDSKHGITLELILTHGMRAVLGTALLILSIIYRSTPLFTLPENLDLSPFNFIISYPNDSNVVTFHFWVLCCTTTGRLLKI